VAPLLLLLLLLLLPLLSMSGLIGASTDG